MKIENDEVRYYWLKLGETLSAGPGALAQESESFSENCGREGFRKSGGETIISHRLRATNGSERVALSDQRQLFILQRLSSFVLALIVFQTP